MRIRQIDIKTIYQLCQYVYDKIFEKYSRAWLPIRAEARALARTSVRWSLGHREVFDPYFMVTKTGSFDIELFFSALADRTRLRLINLMGDDEVCVCYFAEVIDTNQPKISRHLAYLKRAGLVSVRRDWKWAHYRVIVPANEYAARVLRDVQEWLKNDPEMQRDRKEMVNMCCAPVMQQPISIQGAPKPKSLVV